MAISENKIKDKLKRKEEKDFKYKKIPHTENHIRCTRCKYEDAEQSLKNHKKDGSDLDKHKFKELDGNNNIVTVERTFVSMEVIRGEDDDVIGWNKQWQ